MGSYLTFNNHNEFKQNFVICKSRNAPIKENLLSIPKLELKQSYCKNQNQDNTGAERSSQLPV